MRKIFLPLLLFIHVFSGFLYAADLNVKSDPDLHKTIGSRVLGLGGAFTAIADDANAVFINPAGILQLKGNAMDMGYNIDSEQDFYAGHMSFANSSPQDGEAGGLGFYTKGDKVTDGKNRQYVILVSLAQPYGKNFYFGGSAKYIKTSDRKEILDTTGLNVTSTKDSAFSFDLGILMKMNEFVSFGVSGYDLGKPGISTNPRKVTMGLGLNLKPVIDIGVDVDHFAQKDSRQPDLHVGIDIMPQQSISFQLGYFTDKLNNSKTATGGFRLQLMQKDRNDYLGYAYSEELSAGLDEKTEKLHSFSVGLVY